jgi:predicted nuclease with RNAse H fold
MRALGIDLAAEAKSTGAVMIEPVGIDRWRATELDGPVDDDRLVRGAHDADVTGVDAPLGWPVAFVRAVSAHDALQPWPGPTQRATLTQRDTDRAVRSLGVGNPLSVSADKLGSVAMRCALLQRRWAEEVWTFQAPRDGSGPLVETYPAAALRAWQIDSRGYKNRSDQDDARRVRAEVVDAIDGAVRGWLDLQAVRARCITSDHVLDALVCALVAIAAKVEATNVPEEHQRHAALVEGWIHVPTTPLASVAPPAASQEATLSLGPE